MNLDTQCPGGAPPAASPAVRVRLSAALPAPLTMLTGFYGSGKTEIALNLSLDAASDADPIHLIDLDFMKPCFRSRELSETLAAGGVDLVAPRGVLRRADMPIVMPAVAPLLAGDRPGRVVVDLAGDPGGARALAQFASMLGTRPYDLVMVVNTLRPFASTVERIGQARRDLEAVTRLRITALLANTNLGAETTPAMVGEGWDITAAAADANGIPVRALTVPDFLQGHLCASRFAAPLVWLHRYVLPPWEAESIGTEGS